jgi:DNA polymerase sigma
MIMVWGFNDPYTGGLSSYALFLLIVSFLQAKQTPTELYQVNLGRILLDFLKYYAELDVKKFAIACSTPG